MSDWLSSLTALQRLRDAGVTDPLRTLTHLAEARQIRARATWGRFDHLDEDRVFPKEPQVDTQSDDVFEPWPDIPADFWRWVNAGKLGTEAHGDAGVFATTVIYNPEAGDYSDREHIKLFGVTFLADDLAAVLTGAPVSHDSPALKLPARSAAGRKPELDRWTEFGGALALVLHTSGPDVLRSDNALYEAAAAALTAAGRTPLTKKTVISMVRCARLWIEEDGIPALPAAE